MTLPAIAAAGLRRVAAALSGPQRTAAFSVGQERAGGATRPNDAGTQGAPNALPAWLTAQMQVGGAQADATRVRAAYAGGASLAG